VEPPARGSSGSGGRSGRQAGSRLDSAQEVPEIGAIDQKSHIKIVYGLLNRGVAREKDTSLFADMRHEDLVRKFTDYLNMHRHFLGYCHIEQSHALNDKGVDLLLKAGMCKIGFQLKSHHDVREEDFAANVKRQLAESFTHNLDQYFILVCSPIRYKGESYNMKISNLLNELSFMKTNYHAAYGPLNTVNYFRKLPPVSRDELLIQKAIDEDTLHDYERGYEHMPEIDDAEIQAAQRKLDEFGEDWFDSEAGQNAFDELTRLMYSKEAEQFRNTFLPAIPARIRKRREKLVSGISALLAECRACKSWDDRSEYKLGSWLDHVPEEMIPYTSLPNLLRIKESIGEYLRIHKQMDKEMSEGRQS
jgi:hypothetical protein